MSVQVKPVIEPVRRPDPEPAIPAWRRAIALILKTLVPLAILAAAAYGTWTLYLSAPVAERTERPRVARLVEVIEVAPAARGPAIEAWGEVVAARTLIVRPEVEGTVVAVSDRLTPGALIPAGEEIIRLDDRALRLALAQAEAAMRQIEARIVTEEGQHERARRDLERLPGKLSQQQQDLVLRLPQMAELEGELAAAEAVRDQAEVALSKTVIRAPFDALVLDEQVALGTMLGAGTAAATLVAADRFHVVVAVPLSALDWVQPEQGQMLRLTQPASWPEGSFREGRVERLSAGLTQTGRMAELVVAVEDPLAREPANRGKPRLLLGSFLRATGEGRAIEGAVALDRAYLREHDTVWLMTPDNRLEIRKVTVAWRGAEQVLISGGLAAGDRVVTTALAVVAPGMELRTAGGGG